MTRWLAALVVALALVATPACSQSKREQTIHAALLTTDATHEAFVAFDRSHQLQLVSAAKSELEGQLQLKLYRQERDRVVLILEATYRAIAAAAVLEDDAKSLPALIETATLLKQAMTSLQGAQ